MLKKIARLLSIAVMTLVTLGLAGLLGLVYWPEPQFTSAPPNLTNQPSPGPEISEDGIYWFRVRDGVRLQARHYASDAPLTVLFLHGVLGSSQECKEICSRIRKETRAEVFALDLRGHGASEGTPGDVAHLSQYEEDVADVLTVLHQCKPGASIILAGHSMGGGIVMRYAAARRTPDVAGYLLFAPHLGVNSPTMPTETTEAKPAGQEPFVKLHLPRTIGLALLNGIGIHLFDAKKTLFFNVPSQFPIKAYSFRAMASMAPDDYRTALTADTKPLLVIVGQKDEAFRAEKFPAVVKLHPNGKTVLVEGETHDGILHSETAVKTVVEWLHTTGGARPTGQEKAVS
ncbi:MAG: alpha/beta hydrolase [Blastocatellia bacterium]|nr:alpha/beta hydrolase [Blastocatellia bacterium]